MLNTRGSKAGSSAVANSSSRQSIPFRPHRYVQARGTRRTQQSAITEPEEVQQQSAGPFGKLVDYFLHRASSSLKRGPATCLTCKGVGACECPLCKGTGVMDKEQSRMNQMRHTAQKLQQVLHMDRADYNTEWLVTNRCRRCHGYGSVTCPTCGGLGIRAPGVKTPVQH